MRILFLADARTYHTQRWVNYFVGAGHRCCLITLDPGLPTQAEEFTIGTNILPNFLRYPLSTVRAKSLMELVKPDLVNAHFVPSYGLIGVLLKFHPLVVSTWGSDVLISPRRSWLHRKRAQYVLARADLVTADADVTATAVRELGVDAQRVVVSPMGIERALLGQSDKKEKNQVLILSNRKLEPLYDVATLVRAIPLMMERSKRELRFVILGEGSQKSQLLDLAIKLGVETHLDFKGVVSREALLELYRESDVYVSTSTSDSTSVSLLEAMNFGLIPVVTDIPGNREWIQDGNNGFLFTASSPEALAEKILYAIDHSEAADGFREKNREIILSWAVWENNMRIIEERFKGLTPASA
jgi:glycosyltransferase involved in cell wall biosynthesis